MGSSSNSQGDLAAVLRGEARWCVVNDDNRHVFHKLPDRAIDCTITDPPYSEHVHARHRVGRTKLPDETRRVKEGGRRSRPGSRAKQLGFEHLTEALRERTARELGRLTKRWCLVFSDEESGHLWRGALEAAKLPHIRSGAWVKIGSAPQFTGDRPASGFEVIEIAHPKGRKRWNGGGSHAVWTDPIVLDRAGHGSGERLHTTQKPLSLMLKLVDLFTDPDDLVFDPFCGSGTTGAACVRLGRRFIGIEQDAEYAKVSIDRIAAEVEGISLQAARAGQIALFGG
jgi:hypothetical protein